MSGVAGFSKAMESGDVGEWSPMILSRTHHAPPFPTLAQLRDTFRGSLRPPCKRRAPLSPKQSAKVRWKRQRRTRRDWLLWRREWNRRDLLGRLMKQLERDEKRGVKSNVEFNWYERQFQPL